MTGLPVMAHLWRRVGGLVKVDDASTGPTARKSVPTDYILPPLSMEKNVMFIRSCVLTLLFAPCVIAAEPERILMVPEAEDACVLIAETPYGKVIAEIHSPNVYLLENEQYFPGDFITQVVIENAGASSRAENGICVVDGKPVKVTIESLSAELDLKYLKPDLTGLYIFDGEGMIDIGLNVGESRLRIPVELIRVPFKKGNTAIELVEKYGLPASKKPFSVFWPDTKTIDRIIYSPEAGKGAKIGEHWTFAKLPGAIFSIQNGAIAEIGSLLPFVEKKDDEAAMPDQAVIDAKQADQVELKLIELARRKDELEERLRAAKQGKIDRRLSSESAVTKARPSIGEMMGIERGKEVITWQSSDAKRKGIKALETEIENVNAEFIRIRPAVAEQTPIDRKADAKFREWSDTTGQFKLDAIFIKVDGEVVVLKKKDGQEISVPLAKLSEADIKYVRGAK